MMVLYYDRLILSCGGECGSEIPSTDRVAFGLACLLLKWSVSNPIGKLMNSSNTVFLNENGNGNQ
jgi:hypothetical protein